METTQRQQEFHDAMLDLYRRVLRETGHNASKFLEMVGNNDNKGYGAALDLIRAAHPSDTYGWLVINNRLDLTVEAVCLQKEWFDLFTEEDLLRAFNRLRGSAYVPPPGSWTPLGIA